MLDYVNTKSVMHTRGINIDEKQYLFVLSCVLGERPEVAYGMIYHPKEFRKAIESEDEEDYLKEIKADAEIKLELQAEKQLYDLLYSEYNAEIQAKAMSLEDFSFTTGQVVQILQNLLHERSQDLESSSVKDIIALIKTLADQGALQSDDNFSSHFIHVYPPFDVVCTSCGREFDIVKGLDAICPHCKQVYRWSEEERRFYPELAKL